MERSNPGSLPQATPNRQGIRLSALLIGRVEPLGPNGVPSGIAKAPVMAPVRLSRTGIEGDGQGDRVKHGGPEKAVHLYPHDHYAPWAAETEGLPPLSEPGAFGENLSTEGLTEADVAIGDVFRLGTALIEVSQGRQPCFKLNLRFGRADMAARVQSTGRTGWYFRVLEEGIVAPGDALVLQHRVCAEWTVARIWHLFYVDRLNREGLEGIARLSPLAESWRLLARKRLESGLIEDWSRRLNGR